MQLTRLIERLRAHYGPPAPPTMTDPFEMILYENVAYLADDARRDAAFQALRELVGTKPEAIIRAPKATLVEIARLGGMHAETRAGRLRQIADIALRDFKGDLRGVLREPPARAKKLLRRFPAIGEPGAEKILLFSGAYPVLALESNGLRVLTRIGFGRELKSYAATYRSAQEALASQLKLDCTWLTAAHQLLRRHGQEVCRRTRPQCDACPVARDCAYYAVTPAAGGL